MCVRRLVYFQLWHLSLKLIRATFDPGTSYILLQGLCRSDFVLNDLLQDIFMGNEVIFWKLFLNANSGAFSLFPMSLILLLGIHWRFRIKLYAPSPEWEWPRTWQDSNPCWSGRPSQTACTQWSCPTSTSTPGETGDTMTKIINKRMFKLWFPLKV